MLNHLEMEWLMKCCSWLFLNSWRRIVTSGVWSVPLARGLVPTLLRLPEAPNGCCHEEAAAASPWGRQAKQQAMGTVSKRDPGFRFNGNIFSTLLICILGILLFRIWFEWPKAIQEYRPSEHLQFVLQFAVGKSKFLRLRKYTIQSLKVRQLTTHSLAISQSEILVGYRSLKSPKQKALT